MATSASLRPINQARILNTLRKGSWSRVALAEELGLNRSTVTVIISGLLEQGLVRELDAAPSGAKANGRPRVGVALQGSGAYFGGLELGNELLTAVVTDLTGREIGRASEPTRPENGPENAEERLCELLAGVVGDRRLEGIGLTIPGIVTPAGRLEWAPTLGWRDITLGETARPGSMSRCTSRTTPTPRRWRRSSCATPRRVTTCCLCCSTPASAPVSWSHRRLYRGGAGRVGESGHIRLPAADGSTGAEVEDVIGRQAILRAYRSDAGVEQHDATWEDLLAAVEAGEPSAEHLRDRWQAILGWLTAALAWTLDPDVIVFGGPASALLQSDTTALHRSLRNNGPAGITNAWRLSSLGPQGAALGAVALSQRAFFAIPPLLQPSNCRASLEVAS